MLRIELQIEQGAIVISSLEESTDSLKDELEMERASNEALAREGVRLRAEVLLLKERNKTAIGRCIMKQNENDCLRDMHTSQRMEIETCVKQIKEVEIINRMLKADKDKLRQKLFVKYYPTDALIKVKKERDELQMKLDTLDTWLTSLREKTYRTV